MGTDHGRPQNQEATGNQVNIKLLKAWTNEDGTFGLVLDDGKGNQVKIDRAWLKEPPKFVQDDQVFPLEELSLNFRFLGIEE